MLAKRKMRVTELTERIAITMAKVSILKNGKEKAVRFSTLEDICKLWTVNSKTRTFTD
ncbi:helix-turn-helix domain-containing protein [Bacillus cihuensis]|uniref:helix-turn-helix domain-containing protein n=1 Tax=Bacillus cihuensis TaxID=1208599 RepID=UPI000402E930|nr:helix-turn-helix domain-containing protein [Bacillus cihuensis]